MLATVERSGVVEQWHHGSIAIVDRNGTVVATGGDVDVPFFIRSSAKPFQALVSYRHAPHLSPVQLALACASHTAEPVHVAIVRDLLARHGLAADALRCPSARPAVSADRRLAQNGDVAPSREYHNCSGKHAGMLAACVTAGWDTDTYLEPDHPLQREIAGVIADVTGSEVGPPGIDGCGAPVWQTTTVGLARSFSRLANDPELSPMRVAMARYPLLVSGSNRIDGILARSLGAVVKGGAAGCMGLAVARHGIGVKSWDGTSEIAGVGAGVALRHLGVMTPAVASSIESVTNPGVLGGGRIVGRIRPQMTLETS